GQGVFETQIVSGSLGLLAGAGNVDIILYGRGFPSRLDRSSPVGRIWEQAVEKHPHILFILMALSGGHLHASQSADVPVVEPTLQLGGIPFLQGSEYGLKAIAALIRYAEFQRQRQRQPGAARQRRSPASAGDGARALVRASGGRPLTERESKAVLSLYGIRTTRESLVNSADGAVAAAREIGFPVVLKVESPELLHKTEAGAVLLGVEDSEAAAEGYERVLKNARRAAPRAEIRGVLVQEMVQSG